MKALSSALWKIHLDLMEINSIRVRIAVSALQWARFLFQVELPISLSQSRECFLLVLSAPAA